MQVPKHFLGRSMVNKLVPNSVGLVKFNGCSLGNLGQMCIGGVIRDHSSTMLRWVLKL